MSERSLIVFHGPDEVGTLSETWRFTYAERWLNHGFAISASLAFSSTLHEGPTVQAWFANLLPEGGARESLCRRLGLSVDNDFALLEAIGADCAGALSLTKAAPDLGPPVYERIPKRYFSQLRVAPPKLKGDRPLRLSLAGAQEKLAVARFGGAKAPLLLPKGGRAASTHILKLPNPRFAGLAENEVLVTRLADAIGLPVPAIELISFGDTYGSLTERYDRRVDEDTGGQEPAVTRLHQEDLCQAVGVSHHRKYAAEGGPGASELFGHIRRASALPVVDIEHAVRWMLFNLMVRNADAHGKNVSFVLGTSTRLAPFYDLVSTGAYARNLVSRNLAMPFGDVSDPGQIYRGQLEAFAKEAKVAPRIVLSTLEKLAEELPGALDAAAEGIPGSMPERIAAVVKKQVRRLKKSCASG